jgi:hypothetical protein
MVGANLVNRVRIELRDVVTDVNQGTFWFDTEILAVLNACQYSFINYCFSRGFYKDLFLLMTSVNVRQQDTLPTDYLHYQSGSVEKFAFDVPAKIFLGGDGCTYLNSDLDAMIIINNMNHIFNV